MEEQGQQGMEYNLNDLHQAVKKLEKDTGCDVYIGSRDVDEETSVLAVSLASQGFVSQVMFDTEQMQEAEGAEVPSLSFDLARNPYLQEAHAVLRRKLIEVQSKKN